MATPKIYDSGNTTANLAKLSFDKAFARYMPNGTAPLFALTSELKSDTITNITHGYFTKTMLFGICTLTALVANGTDATFTVDSTASLAPMQLLRVNTTGEIVQVLTIASATSITVRRGAGNVAGAAIANSVKLYVVGNAFEQASVRPTAQRLAMTQVTNNTQIFRNTWLMSGSNAAIELIAGDSATAEDKADCMALHARDIETMLFWGQKSLTTLNNQVISTSDGLESYIRTYASGNISTAGSTTTYDQLEVMLDVVLNTVTDPKSGNKRVIFTGATGFKVINAIGRKSGTFQLVESSTSFGLQFRKFKTSRGEFMLIEHPVFNSNADWSATAFIVDLSTLRLAYLEGRKTRHIDIKPLEQDSGLDAVGGTLLTECTLICTNPSANGIIKGLTAAA